MTYGGGKPHPTGDRGQRFAVYCTRGDGVEMEFGWSDTQAGVDRMLASINAHPVWHSPRVVDRQPRSEQFEVLWLGNGRKAAHPADPAYPDGRHIELQAGTDVKFCTVELPYPADACGLHLVKCRTCSANIAITAAGRADDPRSVQVPCHQTLH